MRSNGTWLCRSIGALLPVLCSCGSGGHELVPDGEGFRAVFPSPPSRTTSEQGFPNVAYQSRLDGRSFGVVVIELGDALFLRLNGVLELDRALADFRDFTYRSGNVTYEGVIERDGARGFEFRLRRGETLTHKLVLAQGTRLYSVAVDRPRDAPESPACDRFLASFRCIPEVAVPR